MFFFILQVSHKFFDFINFLYFGQKRQIIMGFLKFFGIRFKKILFITFFIVTFCEIFKISLNFFFTIFVTLSNIQIVYIPIFKICRFSIFIIIFQVFVISFSISINAINAFYPWLFMDGGKGHLPKICHTYPAIMKLSTFIPYLKKIQKINESLESNESYYTKKHRYRLHFDI